MDYSLPGSAVHGILQARILECVAITYSRGILPTQELNLGLLYCRQILYCLNHQIWFRTPNMKMKAKEKVLPLRIAITTIDLIILDLIVQQRDV